MNGFLTTNTSRFVILGRIANPAELAIGKEFRYFEFYILVLICYLFFAI